MTGKTGECLRLSIKLEKVDFNVDFASYLHNYGWCEYVKTGV